VVLGILATRLVCAATVVVIARADDRSVETVGGAVRLMKDRGSIRMVSDRRGGEHHSFSRRERSLR